MAAAAVLDLFEPENSVIRSAVPENTTLESNMRCIGSPVVEIWPFAYGGGIWNPHFGEVEVEGVGDGTIRKSDGSFLQALHCDRCAICNHSAAICDRMSLKLKLTGGVGHFRPKCQSVPLGVDRDVGVC